MPSGAAAAAEDFGVSRNTVHRYLKEYDSQIAHGECMDLSRRRKGRCGHRTSTFNAWEVPSIHRRSYRKWAAKAGVSLASLWRLCQEEKVRKVKRWIKPVLSDQQKVDGLGFVLRHTHRRGGSGVFVDNLYNWVHVNEKWFYILKDGKGVYLHPTEPPP
ncbi:unnamed protein product, partial [Discosporangium mesarthrocarpum]